MVLEKALKHNFLLDCLKVNRKLSAYEFIQKKIIISEAKHANFFIQRAKVHISPQHYSTCLTLFAQFSSILGEAKTT